MKSSELLVVRLGGKPYPRNSIVLDALRDRFDVREIVCEPDARFKNLSVLAGLWRARGHSKKILFLFPAQIFFPVMAFCRYFLRMRVYVDAFISVYESAVHDRRAVKPMSIGAFRLFLLDFLAGRFAHVLLFDTGSSEKYFHSTFRPRAARQTLPVCVDLPHIDSITPAPRDDAHRRFQVFFYGSYIPLQGIEYILAAADMLRDLQGVEFMLVGAGQTKPEMIKIAQAKSLAAVRFLDAMPYEKLISMIKSADVCLGIFGATAKAAKVIPNKIIDYLACGRPTISGRNAELEACFADRQDIIYCRMGDAGDLASKIREARGADSLAVMGRNGRKKVERLFSRTVLEARLYDIFK